MLPFHHRFCSQLNYCTEHAEYMGQIALNDRNNTVDAVSLLDIIYEKAIAYGKEGI